MYKTITQQWKREVSSSAAKGESNEKANSDMELSLHTSHVLIMMG